MGIIQHVDLEPMVGDPDDHRPETRWAIACDTETEGPCVRSMVCIVEQIAPGDRIPLHSHTTDELVLVDAGSGEYTLGEDRRQVTSGSIVFVPAGVPHSTVNVGAGTLDIHAVFPGPMLDITYLERNSAPGTERQPPQPPLRFDPRAGTAWRG